MATAQRTKSRYTRIWAALKAAGLTSEELHEMVYRDYEVDSLTKLCDQQVDSLGSYLWDMASGRCSTPLPNKQKQTRTDEGGRVATVKQRKKIYMLATSMGWSPEDIDAFAKQQYGNDSHKWLNPKQCSDMITALDAMNKRTKNTTVQHEG